MPGRSLILVALVALVGCATPETAVDPVGALPDDLMIDVAIHTGPDAPPKAQADLRRGHFVVFPDGSLHGEQAREIHWGTRPGLVRRLSREQMAALWTEASQLGLTDPQRGDRIGNPALVTAADDETLWLLEFSAADSRWRFIRSFSPGDEPDPAVRQFIRSVAALAWATDLDEGQVRIAPIRYDLGPDPHARFRP